MLPRARILVVTLFALIAIAPAAHAQDSVQVQVSSGVQYRLIGRWDIDHLNEILQSDAPKFFGVSINYTPARNAVRLYHVTYNSVIPERGNRPTVASGLLAIPDTADTSFPMVSYQHGTVYGKQEVPSFPDQSGETKLMIAQFAAQGYIISGADYFGLGQSTEPEGYIVKASHQQATFDMLMASRAVLAHMKLSATRLHLAGWSQGGFVTMAFLEKLESAGVAVRSAATASAPVDAYVILSGFLDFPRSNDATWVPTLFILTAFSYENYYGIPGLARSVINDDQYEVSRKLYERTLTDIAAVPTDLRKLVRADYFDPQFFAASAYGKIAAQTQAYRWIIRTPVRNYYGGKDEVISEGLGRLAMTYQRAIGSGNTAVEALSTGATDHRGTFATAVPQWKTWFDAN